MRLQELAIRTALEGNYWKDLKGFLDEASDGSGCGGGEHLGLVLNFMSKIIPINVYIYGWVGYGNREKENGVQVKGIGKEWKVEIKIVFFYFLWN